MKEGYKMDMGNKSDNLTNNTIDGNIDNNNELALVYMVAGLSSRFGGKIKQLVKVGPAGESLIEYSINQALPAGFTKIIFVVGEKTEEGFKEVFSDNYKGVPVFYARQSYNKEKRERPWGTADALISAVEFLDCKCVICNGDDLYGEESYKILVNHLKNTNEDSVVTLKLIDVLPEKGVVTRGIFTEKNDYLTSAIEVFGISRENLHERGLIEDSIVNINLFGLQPRTVKKMQYKVEKFKREHARNSKVECFIHVELANLAKNGEIKMKVFKSDNKWVGITNPEDEEAMREVLQNKQA